MILLKLCADVCVIQMGRVLPLIARSVLQATLPDIPHDEVDYNVVQNNGKSLFSVIRIENSAARVPTSSISELVLAVLRS